MQNESLTISFIERFAAFFIDFIILTLITLAVCFIIVVPIMLGLKPGDDARIVIRLSNIILLANFIAVMFKDIRTGQSIGKKIMKLQVRDSTDTTKLPNKGKLILRNTTLILWFIEVIVLLISKRRIGDIIASTCVVKIQ